MTEELWIYPCLDGLIYYPIYLAIELFGYTGTLQEQGVESLGPSGNNQSIVWSFTSRLDSKTVYKIVLHPATGSDQGALDSILQVNENGSPVTCVAIADPICAVKRNGDQSLLKIAATFINRIALWGVALKPRGKSYVGSSVQMRSLLARVAKGLPLDGPQEFPDLVFGYNAAGYTTEYLARGLLDKFRIQNVKSDVSGFGQAELNELVKKKGGCNVVFTNSPWLKEHYEQLQLGVKLEVLPLFPPVPFPFSSVITTRTDRRPKILEYFLENLVTAVSFGYRHPDAAVRYLVRHAERFREFGLPKGANIPNLIQSAVGLLNGSDVYSEECHNPWIPCDYALELLERPKEVSPHVWTTFFQQWFRTANHIPPATNAQMAPNEEFFQAEFRVRIDKMRKASSAV